MHSKPWQCLKLAGKVLKLETGLVNHSLAKYSLPPIYTKFYQNTTTPIHLLIVYDCFSTTMADFRIDNRDFRIYKAQDIYHLAVYTRNLPTFELIKRLQTDKNQNQKQNINLLRIRNRHSKWSLKKIQSVGRSIQCNMKEPRGKYYFRKQRLINSLRCYVESSQDKV